MSAVPEKYPVNDGHRQRSIFARSTAPTNNFLQLIRGGFTHDLVKRNETGRGLHTRTTRLDPRASLMQPLRSMGPFMDSTSSRVVRAVVFAAILGLHGEAIGQQPRIGQRVDRRETRSSSAGSFIIPRRRSSSGPTRAAMTPIAWSADSSPWIRPTHRRLKRKGSLAAIVSACAGRD